MRGGGECGRLFRALSRPAREAEAQVGPPGCSLRLSLAEPVLGDYLVYCQLHLPSGPVSERWAASSSSATTVRINLKNKSKIFNDIS